MFTLDPNILISILIVTAILVYIFILKKLGPEKILTRMTSNKTSELEKTREVSKEKKPENKTEETEKSEGKKPENRAEETEKSKEKKGLLKRKKKKKHIEDATSSSVCLHEFGYLGTLPKNASIPDECLGCTKIIECLAQK